MYIYIYIIAWYIILEYYIYIYINMTLYIIYIESFTDKSSACVLSIYLIFFDFVASSISAARGPEFPAGAPNLRALRGLKRFFRDQMEIRWQKMRKSWFLSGDFMWSMGILCEVWGFYVKYGDFMGMIMILWWWGMKTKLIWMMGVPPVIILILVGFSVINQPAIWVPLF